MHDHSIHTSIHRHIHIFIAAVSISVLLSPPALTEQIEKVDPPPTPPNCRDTSAPAKPPAKPRQVQADCCCAKIAEEEAAKSQTLVTAKALAELYKAQAEHSNKLAEDTIADVDRQVSFLTKLWTFVAFAGGLVIASLAFFGIKGIQDVWRLRDALREALAKLKEDSRQLESELKDVFEAARLNHETMMQCYMASRVIDSVETKDPAHAKVLLADTSQRLAKVLSAAPARRDSAILAWAYNLYGYIEAELGRYNSALDAAKKSLDLVEDSPDAHYNAACYAAHLGQKQQALRWLERAIELAPSYKEDAKVDPDLEPLRADPEFIRITAP